MRRLTEPRSLAALTLMLLIGSPAWAGPILQETDVHKINTSEPESTVGYTSIVVELDKEGEYTIKASRKDESEDNPGQTDPFFYLFEGTENDLGDVVASSKNEFQTGKRKIYYPENDGRNDLLSVFLYAGDYTVAVSDVFNPNGGAPLAFTVQDALSGKNTNIRNGNQGEQFLIEVAVYQGRTGYGDVPEPSMLGLLGVGLIAGCAVKRRRRLAACSRGIA